MEHNCQKPYAARAPLPRPVDHPWDRPLEPPQHRPTREPRPAKTRPKLRKESQQFMDTGRLLLAFLTFGAACTTLWAWMLANSGANATGASVSPRIRQ